MTLGLVSVIRSKQVSLRGPLPRPSPISRRAASSDHDGRAEIGQPASSVLRSSPGQPANTASWATSGRLQRIAAAAIHRSAL